jgi:CheY-like chemotaxis protein
LERAQGGLGIGLSIVRNLMAMHGGTVAASSAGLGRGSTFTLRLPAVAAPVREAAVAPEISEGDENPALRIVVIDDNRDAADMLAMMLGLDGHQTRVEYDPVAGLDTLRDFAADVVFCDIGLPQMDGYEVARRIKADTAHSQPILVALTGWGSQEDKNRAKAAGFNFHVTKPVAPEAVRALLHEVVAGPGPGSGW